MELLSLPVGDYVVRVRCRSKNSQLWSRWSSNLLMSIPSRPSAGAAPPGRCYGNNSVKDIVFCYLLLCTHVVTPHWSMAGKLLVQVLVAVLGIGTVLVITFGIIPQSKR